MVYCRGFRTWFDVQCSGYRRAHFPSIGTGFSDTAPWTMFPVRAYACAAQPRGSQWLLLPGLQGVARKTEQTVCGYLSTWTSHNKNVLCRVSDGASLYCPSRSGQEIPWRLALIAALVARPAWLAGLAGGAPSTVGESLHLPGLELDSLSMWYSKHSVPGSVMRKTIVCVVWHVAHGQFRPLSVGGRLVFAWVWCHSSFVG